MTNHQYILENRWSKLTFQKGLSLALIGLLIGIFWTKPSIPRFLSEITGFILIILILSKHKTSLPISRTIRIALPVAVAGMLVYLLPLPIHLWQELPGRNLYQPVIQLIESQNQYSYWHSISLDPYATTQTLLAMLPPLAMFLGVTLLTPRQLYLLVAVLLAAAGIQAIWGIIQYATTGVAQGSYTNRNHYAALMGLALPMTAGLWAYHANLDKMRMLLSTHSLYITAFTFILIGGLVSTSRAGTTGLLLGFLLSYLVFWKKPSKKILLVAGIACLSLLMIAITTFDLTHVVDRFTTLNPLEDPRWVMFRQAGVGIMAFFPVGSGPGTFADVYTAFQPVEKIGWAFIKHAHNDYLELFFEMGVIGIGMLIAFLAYFIYNLRQVWQQRHSELFHLKASSAIGIIVGLFHAFFDFNFHTPTYPVFFALMTGVFFAQKSNPESDCHHSHS